MSMRVPEQYRVRSGALATTEAFGNNGAFVLPVLKRAIVHVIASDGEGWEHVSVSLDPQTMGAKNAQRCPTWEEMDALKRLFWDDSDCVAQLHVPRKDWVNCHPYTLHLWRQISHEWAQPDSIMVGVK